ncbi:hypothetical protein EON65_19465 [archaeon]|nr:MAG: hypothetical protein EON65_19465 [archaeon]
MRPRLASVLVVGSRVIATLITFMLRWRFSYMDRGLDKARRALEAGVLALLLNIMDLCISLGEYSLSGVLRGDWV